MEPEDEQREAPAEVCEVQLRIDPSRMLWKDWRLVRGLGQRKADAQPQGEEIMALMDLIDRVTVGVEGVSSIDELPPGDVFAAFMAAIGQQLAEVKN